MMKPPPAREKPKFPWLVTWRVGAVPQGTYGGRPTRRRRSSEAGQSRTDRSARGPAHFLGHQVRSAQVAHRRGSPYSIKCSLPASIS